MGALIDKDGKLTHLAKDQIIEALRVKLLEGRADANRFRDGLERIKNFKESVHSDKMVFKMKEIARKSLGECGHENRKF